MSEDLLKSISAELSELKAKLAKTENKVYNIQKDINSLAKTVESHDQIIPSIDLRFAQLESGILQKIDDKDSLILDEVRIIKNENDNYRVEQLEKQLEMERENNKYKNRTIIGLMITVGTIILGAFVNYFL